MSAEIANTTPEAVIPTLSKPLLDAAQASIDAPDLVPLLQCLGFVLLSMDKEDSSLDLLKLLKNQEENAIKIEITCVKSGSKATLLKHGCHCKCPTEDQQVWNVSGCVQGNTSMTRSNSVPTISLAKSRTINTLLTKCMEFIITSNGGHDSSDSADGSRHLLMMKKQFSFDNLKPDNASKITIGPTPPRHSSSPIVPDLCKNIKLHTSTTSATSLEGTESKLSEILKNIDKLVKKAIDMTNGTNATFTKTRPSDVGLIKISPLAPTGIDSSQQSETQSVPGTSNASSVVPPKDLKSTPAGNTPKKQQSSSTGTKKKGLVPQSRLNLLKYRRESSSSSMSKATSSAMVKDKTGKSLNLSAAKVKTAINSDSGLQAKFKPKIFGSKIGTKKL